MPSETDKQTSKPKTLVSQALASALIQRAELDWIAVLAGQDFEVEHARIKLAHIDYSAPLFHQNKPRFAQLQFSETHAQLAFLYKD